MALAVRAVSEGLGRIFVHRRDSTLNPGDVEFATQLSDLPTFFVIDEAASVGAELANTVSLMRQSQRPTFFLIGDRLNEWRQARPTLRGREHMIDVLSDGEIERLLDYLEKNDALGRLEHLSHDFQVAAIRNKFDKQLLVIMREATEGRGFDAIIEDEFRHIEDEFARRVYALVCCFYHLRVPVRDQVLAKLLNVSLERLYSLTGAATEGVIYYDCFNEAKGEYAARARHQSIADIIWERCVGAPDRDSLLLRAMDALNLNYNLDARIFEAFVRSDRDIDALTSLDSRIKYFEAACRKDPDSPYVRQHYARMLLRASRPELALSQIELALSRSSSLRVLHHTKGEVLKQLAITTASEDVARKYLVRSEASYRQAQAASARDPFAYQGLADLYLAWAKRASTEEEAADYLAKSQDVINKGLLSARDKESLWIISARIQDWLGDKPGALTALQKAVAVAPDASISRYLLGRAYKRRGQHEEVLATLAPTIKADPNQYEACLLYAEALLRLGKPREEAVAILQMGSLYGLRDPRYIATLGGLLTMTGRLTEGAEVFRRGRSLEFGVDELRENLFVPQDLSSVALRMKGILSNVNPGFVWISVPGFPDFYCFGSKFGGVVARKGLSVEFTPAFSARGTYARDVVVS